MLEVVLENIRPWWQLQEVPLLMSIHRILAFQEANDKQSYSLTIQYTGDNNGTVSFGSLTWTEVGSNHTVRSSIVASPYQMSNGLNERFRGGLSTLILSEFQTDSRIKYTYFVRISVIRYWKEKDAAVMQEQACLTIFSLQNGNQKKRKRKNNRMLPVIFVLYIWMFN